MSSTSVHSFAQTLIHFAISSRSTLLRNLVDKVTETHAAAPSVRLGLRAGTLGGVATATIASTPLRSWAAEILALARVSHVARVAAVGT